MNTKYSLVVLLLLLSPLTMSQTIYGIDCQSEAYKEWPSTYADGELIFHKDNYLKLAIKFDHVIFFSASRSYAFQCNKNTWINFLSIYETLINDFGKEHKDKSNLSENELKDIEYFLAWSKNSDTEKVFDEDVKKGLVYLEYKVKNKTQYIIKKWETPDYNISLLWDSGQILISTEKY